MVMYDNGFKTKENKTWTKDKILLSHNIYIKETRQNRDSHIFAGRWFFAFGLPVLKWIQLYKIAGEKNRSPITRY